VLILDSRIWHFVDEKVRHSADWMLCLTQMKPHMCECHFSDGVAVQISRTLITMYKSYSSFHPSITRPPSSLTEGRRYITESVERHVETTMQAQLCVDFFGAVEWFIGT
jgi:hypothetical protein